MTRGIKRWQPHRPRLAAALGPARRPRPAHLLGRHRARADRTSAAAGSRQVEDVRVHLHGREAGPAADVTTSAT